jgi:hypothetical protein
MVTPTLSGSRFGVQARPGATGCVYEIAFTFYGIGFPSPHLGMPGLGQGFKGYNPLILLPILIKIWHTRHTSLSETDLYPDEDTIPLIQAVWAFSTRNVEP